MTFGFSSHNRGWHAARRLAAGGLVAAALGLSACLPAQSGMSSIEAMQRISQEPLNSEPWTFAYAPGLQITTTHYRIYTTVRDPLYQRLLGKVLEAAYDRAQRLRPSDRTQEAMTCYVFGDRHQWEAYTRLRAGSNAPVYLRISAGGYCQEGVFAGYHINDRNRTLSVIAHEAWHQYSWFAFKDRLPSWLEEGLATQNESLRWEGTEPTFVPQLNYDRFTALKDGYREGRLWKFSDLTSTHAGKEISKSEKDVGLYYAQLWSLVMFLENSKYRPQLTRMLDDARDGKLSACLAGRGVSPAEIAGFTEKWNRVAGPVYMQTYFNPDMGKIEGEYKAWVKEFVSTWPPKVGG